MTIARQLYEYMISLPYGAEISTLEAFRMVFPDLEVPYDDMFDVHNEVCSLFESSEEYFLDPSEYVGVSSGLPFSIPFVIRTYDGIIREFEKKRINKYGCRHLVHISSGQSLSLEDVYRCSVAWWIVVEGQGQFMTKVIAKGYSYAYEDPWNYSDNEKRVLVNTSEEDLLVYYVVVFEKDTVVQDDRHESLQVY